MPPKAPVAATSVEIDFWYYNISLCIIQPQFSLIYLDLHWFTLIYLTVLIKEVNIPQCASSRNLYGNRFLILQHRLIQHWFPIATLKPSCLLLQKTMTNSKMSPLNLLRAYLKVVFFHYCCLVHYMKKLIIWQIKHIYIINVLKATHLQLI